MKQLLLALLTLLLLPHISFAEQPFRTISVNGHSVITVEPQFAIIQAQIRIVSPSVEESYTGVTSTLTELATKLQPLGIKKEDITTSVISQGAEYDYSKNERTLRGYFSSCSLGIKLHTIADTYRVYAELAKYTSVSVGNTEYGRNDEAELQTAALQESLKIAKEKATAMAATLGTDLGQVLTISEAGSQPNPIVTSEMHMKVSSAGPGDLTTTGSVTITGNVMVEFELLPKP